jgi:glucokinase
MILAGDVGATKVLLEIGSVQGKRWRPVFAKRYAASEFADFESVLEAFLSEGPARKIRSGCLGVAGPARGNRVQMTNLPWALDGEAIARRFGIGRVRVVNDFAAAASGIALLGPADLVTLQAGEPSPDAPRVVIGAGSGLGVAYSIPLDGRQEIVAGEGGHAGFAPASVDQLELWRDLHERRGRVAAEDVVSGPGLVRVFEFVCRSEGKAPGSVLAGGGAPAIVRGALELGEPTCARALDLFVSCYGSVTGDHALAVLARGGVYVCGGIAPAILRRLLAGGFAAAFNDKGSHSALARKMPVFVVVNEALGVLGAAALASGAGPTATGASPP